jgi:4-hydroxy-tetrahydrodipicolinate synthase
MSSIRDRIKGSITALITPFKDGKVDEAAFRKLVNWQIAEGTQGWFRAAPPANPHPQS